ncbi:MAG: FlgD immunoglobulin-like domain containing protein [bacterium]
MFTKRFLLGLAVSAMALPAYAMWSSDPATNLSIADAASDQAQPKIAPTSDGGCYISWFDGIGNGYDVRVQKLDVFGNEVFAHNGVLVANLSLSSTTDYGIDVDAAGNALLTFQDDRFGGLQVTAAKVSPAGALLWGVNGIQLTSTADFVANPKIAGTSDGACVVAWLQNSVVKLQRLDANGAPIWGTVLTLTPPTGSYFTSDLHAFGTDVVFSFVHQTGGFTSPKHLLAQKIDATGALLWGASHVAVFDGGSLQFGNYPAFVPDGSGGGVFFWYNTASPQLQSYAQHILANGTEAFPHNGTPVSADVSRGRVEPWAAFNASTNETYVFWEEENSLQSQFGLYGQKLDASGNRQWGGSGIALIPLGSTSILWIRTLLVSAGPFVFWSAEPGANQDRLYGMRLDATGAVDIPTFNVASTPSGKMRLFAAKDAEPMAILAWADARHDGGDILVQNVNSDGSLGFVGDIGAPEVSAGAAALALSARPNPTKGAVQLEYAAPASAALSLQVVDVSGRVVRQLRSGAGSAGSATWDGRDDVGARVAAGVYFVRLKSGAAMRTERVTLIR